MEKKKIVCPNCGQRMRIPKRKNINFKCTRCDAEIQYSGKDRYTFRNLIIITIAILIFHFFFFKDYLAYRKVQQSYHKYECWNYYNQFPNGFFTEEVKFIEIQAVKDIELVRRFLDTYPESEKRQEVLDINEDLWDSELKRYDEIVKTKTGIDSSAVTFFKDMLLYMRDHNMSTITLNMTRNVNVKNFEEYSDNVRDNMDKATQKLDNRTITGHIINIKKNYSEEYIDSYEQIIRKAIETGFENILSKNFIKIAINNYSKNSLTIKIAYNIKNQEDNDIGEEPYPSIWTYYTTIDFKEYFNLLGLNSPMLAS